jgi:2-amino-4-hydroxy-6-hydroxymethyldihydropteridine diphosphokinase
MEKFNKVYLLIGGNLNNTSAKYEKLFRLLEKNVGKIIIKSSFYQSEAWGFVSEYSFINVALLIETLLLPEELLVKTQEIEKILGRIQKSNSSLYSDRSMDIDILFYNNIIYKSENLTIPHLHIAERIFVLKPLCEIAPNLLHPELKKTVSELTKNCLDMLQIKKISNFVEEN